MGKRKTPNSKAAEKGEQRSKKKSVTANQPQDKRLNVPSKNLFNNFQSSLHDPQMGKMPGFDDITSSEKDIQKRGKTLRTSMLKLPDGGFFDSHRSPDHGTSSFFGLPAR